MAGLVGRQLPSLACGSQPLLCGILSPHGSQFWGNRNKPSQYLGPPCNGRIKLQAHLCPGQGPRSGTSVTMSSPTRLALTGDSAGWSQHSQSLSRQGPFLTFVPPAEPRCSLHVPQGRGDLFQIGTKELPRSANAWAQRPFNNNHPLPPGPLWLPKFPRFPTCFVLDLPCSSWASLPTALASCCIWTQFFFFFLP